MKSLNGAGFLAAYRDQVIEKRLEIIQENKDMTLELANFSRQIKDRMHANKIKINQLDKLAEELQTCIGEEMQTQLDEQERVSQEYHIKSLEEMKVLLEVEQ